MPIFEYRCHQCSETFEKILFKKTETVECPSCGSNETVRLLSAFMVSGGRSRETAETGPCHCGAPRRGMCGMSEN